MTVTSVSEAVSEENIIPSVLHITPTRWICLSEGSVHCQKCPPSKLMPVCCISSGTNIRRRSPQSGPAQSEPRGKHVYCDAQRVGRSDQADHHYRDLDSTPQRQLDPGCSRRPHMLRSPEPYLRISSSEICKEGSSGVRDRRRLGLGAVAHTQKPRPPLAAEDKIADHRRRSHRRESNVKDLEGFRSSFRNRYPVDDFGRVASVVSRGTYDPRVQFQDDATPRDRQ